MNRFGLKQFSRLALLLAAGPALMAQVATGALTGTAKDAKGAPLAGVRVAISSTALFAPRVTTTDERGEWRAPLLPPGSYKITASKDGFFATGVDNIRVGLGSAARFDLVLKPAQAATATVEVVATSAEMDKTDTKSSVNFSAETLATLPAVTRGVAGAADLAPGLTDGIGGSYSVRGGATQNTQYRVNGTDVKDDYQGDLTGTYYIEDNIEDTQVVLSPLNARNGRATGGAINVVTKSGSNTFAGSVRATISRNSWTAINPSYQPGVAGQTADDLNKQYQVVLSGPIIKDRLWFDAGTILNPNQHFSYQLGNPYRTANSVVLTGNAAMDAVLLAGPGGGYAVTKFDANAPYTQAYDSTYWEGKLTGAITANQTLEFSYSHSTTSLGPRDPFGDTDTLVSRLATLGNQTEDKKVYGWAYRAVLSNSAFLDAHINKVDSKAVFPVGDPNFGTGEGMLVYEGNTAKTPGNRAGYSYPFGFGISPTPDRRNNRSGNINLKVFYDLGGSHELDTGYDFYEGVRGTSSASGLNNQFFRAGGVYADPAGNLLFPVINLTPNPSGGWLYGQDGTGLRGAAPSMVQYLGQDGTTKTRMDAIYVNDQWTINDNWNLMLGLRLEQNKITDTDGAEIAKVHDFSPRFQLRYDLNGDSKRVFTLTAARFTGDFTTGFTDAFVKKANSADVQYGWSGNAVAPGTAAGVQFVNYAALTNPANYKKVITFEDSSKNYAVDPGLKTPYMDELTLGFRRGWDNGSSVSLTYVYRTWKQDWAFSTNYLPDQMITLKDPTGSGLPDQYSFLTHVFNSDQLRREYNGLELVWTGKLSSVWTVGGNWTYSRLVGNNNGGDSTTGQSFRDNSPEGYYYQNRILNYMGVPESAYAPTGQLSQDQEMRGRLYLSAVLPLGKGTISYAAMLRYDSGTHYSAVSATPFPGAGVPYLGPGTDAYYPFTYNNYYGGRNIYSNNDTYQVDFKINFQVPLGIPGFEKLALIGDMQVNNLFNHILPVYLDHTLYNGGSYGTTQMYIQDPSTFGTAIPGQGNNYWNTGRNVGMSVGLRF